MRTPRTLRPPCLLISADSGAGKSSLLDHLQQRYPERAHSDAPGPLVRPLVRISIEPLPTILSTQQLLLTVLGAPHLQSRFSPSRNDLICRYIEENGCLAVLVDELQHVRNLTAREQDIFMDWLKWLSSSARVNIIAAGVRSVESLTQRDPQLSTRFALVRLPRWLNDATFSRFLRCYEASLPLRLPSSLGQLPLRKLILEQALALNTLPGITDGIVRVIQEAAIAAIHTGRERITPDLIDAWSTHSPIPEKTTMSVRRLASVESALPGGRDSTARQLPLPLNGGGTVHGPTHSPEQTAGAAAVRRDRRG